MNLPLPIETPNTAQRNVAIAAVSIEPREQTSPEQNVRPFLALLSIVALVCSGLELELLQRVDGMLRYMTLTEILRDAGVALLVLSLIAFAWWICLLLALKMTDSIPWVKQRRAVLFWRLGLTIPLTYFGLNLLDSTRVRFYPHWHPGIFGWLRMGPALILFCIAIVCLTRFSKLQKFCSTRLAPIGWLHIILAVAAIVALWAHGVYIFHDYALPGSAAVASNKPDVYLISVDALRAEDMSLYGYGRPTTPNLERFAQRAYTFDYFFANSNFTTSASASIETGKLPWTHRVFQLGGYLRGREQQQETLAAALRRDGYYTVAISSNCYASPVQHKTQQSYDEIELPSPKNGSRVWGRFTNLVGLNTQHTLSGPLLKALTGVRSYLDLLVWNDHYANPADQDFDLTRAVLEREDIRGPRFIWTHILPPHDPYLAPPPYRGRFLDSSKLTKLYDFIGLQNDSIPPGVTVTELQARYDENVAYADQAIGDFLEWLDRTGHFDQSIIIISADHGESFEHNWFKHTGPLLYNGLIRIPLLIHLPGQKQGSRITEVAGQTDLLPTILDLIGAQPATWSEGVSLKPVLQGKTLPARVVFSMNLEPNSSFEPISQGTLAIMDDNFKYIDRLDSQQVSLYRYRADPREEQNLIHTDPDVANRMHDLLTDKLRQINARDLPNP